jgi:hypothetical protein
MNYPDKAQCSGSASALAQRIGRFEIGKNLQFSTPILINNFRKIMVLPIKRNVLVWD